LNHPRIARRRGEKPEEGVLSMQNIETNPENAALTSHSWKGIKSPERSLNRRNKAAPALKSEKARRLNELQKENAKLKRLVAELSLQKLMLRDILTSRGL
jgi:Skp family chaperone for outer membrane proteins